MGDRLHVRASLAVLLIDDFTGKIITSPSAQVRVSGGKKAIRKPDGFWVFTDLCEETIQITVTDPCYYREERQVWLEGLEAKHPVFRIRLKPNRMNGLPGKTTAVTIRIPEGGIFYIFREQGNDHKKLLADYEKGSDQIAVYQEETEELEGKFCCIMDKNGKKEHFRLGGLTDRERGIYQLEMPLTGSYKRIGTRIFPISRIDADREMEYFIPLKGDQDDEEYTCIFERNGKQKEEKIRLRADISNQIPWQEP